MQDHSTLTGLLLAWRHGIPSVLPWETHSIGVQQLSHDVAWYRLTYVTAEPLLPDDGLPPLDEYRYSYFFRPSGQRFLLVAPHSDLVPPFLSRVVGWSRVVAPQIDIPKLTSDLTRAPGGFCLGAVFARVDGYGKSLRSVALYGNDLADARLFVDLLPQLVPFRVHLRDVVTHHETLSVNTAGEVFFPHRNLESFRSVDRTLAFLSRRRYISWDVERAMQSG